MGIKKGFKRWKNGWAKNLKITKKGTLRAIKNDRPAVYISDWIDMPRKMKKLILITLFLVSWRTFKAEQNTLTGGMYKNTQRGGYIDSDMVPVCELKTEYHQETAENYFKARARQVELENQGGNYDVKIWELKEEAK